MKTSLFVHPKSIATLVATVASFALPFSFMSAHEGHDHGPSPVADAAGGDAWKNAQTSLKEIQTAAAAKQHEPIHNGQEKLVAALKQIQEQGGGADKTRLDGAIKNAIAASEKVHTAADAKDFAKVESSLKTLEATMGMVEKQLGVPAK